jgi:hypothetical protein
VAEKEWLLYLSGLPGTAGRGPATSLMYRGQCLASHRSHRNCIRLIVWLLVRMTIPVPPNEQVSHRVQSLRHAHHGLPFFSGKLGLATNAKVWSVPPATMVKRSPGASGVMLTRTGVFRFVLVPSPSSP